MNNIFAIVFLKGIGNMYINNVYINKEINFFSFNIYSRERSVNMNQKHLFQYVFAQYGLIHMLVKKER